jgi:signal transduction histidine kinase
VSSTIPRYLLLPAGAGDGSLRERLRVLGSLRVVRSEQELFEEAEEPGWILIPSGVDPRVVVSLLCRLGEVEGPWSPLLVVERDGDLDLVPVSTGFRHTLGDVADRLRGDAAGTTLLSFRLALAETSRLRHDINNPLTAALAEVQLLLMDVEADSPVGSALLTTEVQLRRIRDLVAELSAPRPPRR